MFFFEHARGRHEPDVAGGEDRLGITDAERFELLKSLKKSGVIWSNVSSAAIRSAGSKSASVRCPRA